MGTASLKSRLGSRQFVTTNKNQSLQLRNIDGIPHYDPTEAPQNDTFVRI